MVKPAIGSRAKLRTGAALLDPATNPPLSQFLAESLACWSAEPHKPTWAPDMKCASESKATGCILDCREYVEDDDGDDAKAAGTIVDDDAVLVVLLNLDNRNGVVAVRLQHLKPASSLGMAVTIHPLTGDVWENYRGSTEASHPSVPSGFVPVAQAAGGEGVIEAFLAIRKVPGQFCVKVALRPTPELARNARAIVSDVPASSMPRMYSGTEPELFTLTHGFEAKEKKTVTLDGPSPAAASSPVKAAPGAADEMTGPTSAPVAAPAPTTSVREEEEDAAVAGVAATDAADVDAAASGAVVVDTAAEANGDGDDVVDAAVIEDAAPAAAATVVYYAQGYGAEEFNAAMAVNPQHADETQTAVAVPAGDVWGARPGAPSADCALTPSIGPSIAYASSEHSV